MKHAFISSLKILLIVLLLTSCSGKDYPFSITFYDVGQGDSALVECEGHYMLIDGGDKAHGSLIYDDLVDKGIKHLDILAISHTHDDHIGGIPKILTWIDTVDLALCPEVNDESRFLEQYNLQLPIKNKEYKLGGAKVKILNTGSLANDSLVLLITYGNKKFLFTGDIERDQESTLCNELNDDLVVDVLKVSHHGSNESTTVRFLSMLTDPKRKMKQYAIISVGKNNRYGHPGNVTIDRLNQAGFKTFRTDEKGNVYIKTDGTTIVAYSSK